MKEKRAMKSVPERVAGIPAKLVAMLVAGFALAGTGTAVYAQGWAPAQPIRIITPYSTGGTSDIIARSMSIWHLRTHRTPGH